MSILGGIIFRFSIVIMPLVRAKFIFELLFSAKCIIMTCFQQCCFQFSYRNKLAVNCVTLMTELLDFLWASLFIQRNINQSDLIVHTKEVWSVLLWVVVLDFWSFEDFCKYIDINMWLKQISHASPFGMDT